jgi:hypothetical protein
MASVSGEHKTLLTIKDVRGIAEWAVGHPVLGPVARTAIFWYEEAERAKQTAKEWRAEAERLGWRP